MTDSKVIFIESSGTITSVDFSFIDSVKRADGTSSLERELVRSARKSTDSATVQGISCFADASAIRDDLIG